MKNFQFKLALTSLLFVLFLSGCTTATTSPAQQQTPVNNNNSSAEPIGQTKETVNQTVSDVSNVEVIPASSIVYNIAEVSKHNTESDCWQIIDNKVYNLTAFVPNHPGGMKKIIEWCGKDSTKIFNLQHSPETKNLLGQYFLSDLQ